MSKLITTCLMSLFLIVPFKASAQILINEIAWMGSIVSANHEWIELYNPTDQDISLDGWQLNAIDKTPMINLTGIIYSKGYFLLERTNDDAVADILADQIFSGSIGNSGEHFQLFDEIGNLIDEAPFALGWPGGDNITKQTLERTSLNGWATSLEAGGTPKAQNSNVEQPENPEEPEEPEYPECPDCPDCPEVPQCPEIPECPGFRKQMEQP